MQVQCIISWACECYVNEQDMLMLAKIISDANAKKKNAQDSPRSVIREVLVGVSTLWLLAALHLSNSAHLVLGSVC